MAKKHIKSAHKAPASTPASGSSRPQPSSPARGQPLRGAAAGSWTGCVDAVCATALLVLAGAHFAWRVQPILRYEQTAPPFFLDGAFCARFPAVPGALLDYLAAAVAQLNFSAWIGTMAFVLLLGGIFLGARGLLAGLTGRWATAAACGPVALLAALPGRYEEELERTLLGILLSLGAVCAWLAMPTGWHCVRLASAWGLAVVLFFAAGPLPAALSVTLIVLQELLVRRRPWIAAAGVPVLLVVPLWSWFHPAFNPLATVHHWDSGWTRALHALAFLSVPSGLVAGAALAWRVGSQSRSRPQWLPWCVGLLTAFILCGVTLDTSRKAQAQFEQAIRQQQWHRALTIARRLPTWTPAARVQLTRALFHAGRLPEDLFAFPQRRGVDVLPGYEVGLDVARSVASSLLELGQVDLAEHMAHESLELDGARPDTLRLLAQVNILKGQPDAARVFLKRLRLAPFHRREADHLLQLLAADPTGANQPEVDAIRPRLPRTDEPDYRLATESLLRQLLRANPTNRMAFDFLLAHRLLNTQLEELAADLQSADRFGDPTLPRPCEEALLLYQSSAAPVNLRNHQISPATIQRYRRFTDLLQQYPGKQAAARDALAKEFGDTFWFYAFYGETAPRPAGAMRLPQP